MLLGRRTSGTPGLARCLRRGLIPVRANITEGLPQFLVEKKKKSSRTYTKLKDKQRIIGIFIQVVRKQLIPTRRVREKLFM